MKYQCQAPDCQKTFTHPAKNILEETPEQYVDLRQDKTTNAAILQPKVTVKTTLETFVCPFCYSRDFAEYVEPEVASDLLEDMKLVEFQDVVAFVAKGYVELDRDDHVFAKGVVMLKTKAKPVEVREEAKQA